MAHEQQHTRLVKACALFALQLVLGAAPQAFSAEKNVWRALASGGHVALIRHASAPGTGDPSGFRLGECSTQRNLDDAGRAQARRIGDRFRANGIAVAHVYTSEWCRTSETAKLLDLGEVEALPALDSFFQRGNERTQTRAVLDWLAGRDLSQPVVLVTHQVNITAMTGVYPASGEMVVARRTPKGALHVVGRVVVD
jgi:phosphohistidine phosphatase SixA